MKCTYSARADVGVFLLEGSLIHADGALELVENFDLRLSEGVRKFIVDLSSVAHVNSSGLGVFITLDRKCAIAGGRLVFAAPSQYLMQIFIITKLVNLLTITNSPEEAMESLA